MGAGRLKVGKDRNELADAGEFQHIRDIGLRRGDDHPATACLDHLGLREQGTDADGGKEADARQVDHDETLARGDGGELYVDRLAADDIKPPGQGDAGGVLIERLDGQFHMADSLAEMLLLRRLPCHAPAQTGNRRCVAVLWQLFHHLRTDRRCRFPPLCKRRSFAIMPPRRWSRPLSGSVTITLRNDLAELTRLAAAIESFGERMALGGKLVYTLNLALDELVTNVVSYAYDEPAGDRVITVALAVDGSRLTATLEDDGRPFDPLAKGPPDIDSPLEERRIGGLGVHFVRTMMDDVQYSRVDGRNRLTLVKTL